MGYSPEQIRTKVNTVLADALGFDKEDEDQIVPTAILADDLGAESADHLNILFSLGKEFDCPLPRDDFSIYSPKELESLKRYVQDSKLSEEGIRFAQETMPLLNPANILWVGFVGSGYITYQITVEDVYKFVEHQLAKANV